tara:strand:- start:332 stop:583 length:252 start_codon:yes stop_codon:yes gene_type:complete
VVVVAAEVHRVVNQQFLLEQTAAQVAAVAEVIQYLQTKVQEILHQFLLHKEIQEVKVVITLVLQAETKKLQEAVAQAQPVQIQ